MEAYRRLWLELLQFARQSAAISGSPRHVKLLAAMERHTCSLFSPLSFSSLALCVCL
jgi:hypothetical protein